jgi:DNA topoisomerase I
MEILARGYQGTVPRLRMVSPRSAGWSRVRRGRGFSYVDDAGAPLPADAVEFCRSLVIPPAWREVWICPHPNAHLQAVGVDDAGRRQYLYHPEWRRRRDEAKFDHVLDMAARLPGARPTVTRRLRSDGMPRARALSVAFRLLDDGLFRIGGEEYADDEGGYGLITLERRHVRWRRDRVVFSFSGKGGKEQAISLSDPDLVAAVAVLRRRRGGSDRLLAYKDGRRWRDLTSVDVNDHLKELLGEDASAKDFRTWHATVVAAVELAKDRPTSARGRKRAVARAIAEVADYLGNTAAVARSSYVDPRIIDLFEDGRTVDPDIARADLSRRSSRASAERAVLALLTS